MRYQHKRASLDIAMRKRIPDIALTRVRYGYKRVHILLRREGEEINHKRVHRLYCLEGLQIGKKRPRRNVSAARRKVHFTPAKAPTECWAMDFVSDTLVNQKKIRILAVIDVFTKQVVALPVGERLRSEDVVKALSQATQKFGTPKRIF